MVTKKQISEVAAAMGRRGYKVKLERHGLERLQQIARENGKLGGRPRQGETKAKKEKRNDRESRDRRSRWPAG